MKTRTALLIACMLFVPAAAMFSHRVPPGLRTAVREGISAAVAWCVATTRPSAREQPVEPPAPPVPQRDALTAATAVLLATPPASSLAAPAAQSPPAVVAGDRFDPPLPRAAFGDGASPTEEQFARLGASGVECRLLRGVEGVHVASCSVVLDASGQLVRVFQASGPDPATATRSLLDEVTAWRQRVAGRVGQGGPSAGPPADRGQRF